MKFLLWVTTLASLSITAHASTIYILSDALNTTNDSSNPTMDIVRNPNWAPAFGGSDWISYGPTGSHSQPGYFSPPNGTIVTFTTEFTLTGPILGGRLRVLADDTTSVVLNGHTLIAPDITNACAASLIGCLTFTEAVLDFAALSPYLKDGINTLSFAVSQLGGSSFGLDFKGTVRTDPAQTPEPSTWAIIAGGLLCLAIFRKRN